MYVCMYGFILQEEFIATFIKHQEEKLQHDGVHNPALDVSDINLSEKNDQNGHTITNGDYSTKL